MHRCFISQAELTPRRDARELCRAINISPTPARVKQLLPYTATVGLVRDLDPKVKRSLFRGKAKKNAKGIVSALAKKVRLMRKHIFTEPPSTSTRLQIAKCKQVKVQDFLMRPDNSYELPGMRDEVRVVRKFALTDTLIVLHQKFCCEHEDMKVAFSSFAKARPHNIKLIDYTNVKQCVCQRCANKSLQAEALKTLPRGPRDIGQLDEARVRDLLAGVQLPSAIHHRQWMRVDTEEEVKRTKLVDLTVPKEAFITSFVDDLPEFKGHCHRIATQFEQVRVLKAALLPGTEATVQCDFAENWGDKFQNEPAAVYFDSNQTTIHPMVVHYKTAENDRLRSQSYVAVCSDSKTHNAGAIYTFIGRLVAILKRLLPQLARIHFISDSPASQYRNKTMVQVVHRFQQCFGLTASWTWLESGHGKGPCDGVGGAVKRKARNLAKGGAVIRGADEFYQVFNAAGGKVELIHVDPKEVSLGVRKVYAWKAPLVKGLSKMHALACAESGTFVRETSCFQPCCYNISFVKPGCSGWQKVLDVATALPSSSIVAPPTTVDHEEAGTMPTLVDCGLNIRCGSFVTVVYGRRWYPALVTKIKDMELSISYMKASRGYWMWGQRAEGTVDTHEVLAQVSPPTPVEGKTNLYELSRRDLATTKRQFAEL